MQAKKISQLFVDIAYWTPRLVAINFIWLLACLPVITVFRATRAAAILVGEKSKSNSETISVWQSFWYNYRQAKHRCDSFGSLLFFLGLIDALIFLQHKSSWLNSVGFALLLVLIIFLIVCSWHVSMSQSGKNYSWLAVFVLVGQNFWLAGLQVMCIILFIGLLATLFSIFFVLLGGSLILLINLAFAKQAIR